MKIRKKILRALGMALSVCMTLSLAVWAEELPIADEYTVEQSKENVTPEEDVTYDALLKHSYIFHAGKPFYYQYGEKKYYNEQDKGYLLPVDGQKPLLPASFLCTLLGVKYRWNARTEVLELSSRNHIVTLRAGEDCLTADGEVLPLDTPALLEENRLYLSASDVLQYLGFYTFYQEGMVMVSEFQPLPLEEEEHMFLADQFKDLFYDYLVCSNFETIIDGNIFMLEGRKRPVDWTFNNWANPSTPNVDAGITTEEHASGQNAVYINAVDGYMAGFQSPRIPLDKTSAGYKIEFKVKTSEDYANNSVQIMLLFYNNNNFVSSSFKGGVVYSNEEWTANTLIVDQSSYPSKEADSFQVVVMTSFSGSAGIQGQGKVFYDDVKISYFLPDSNTVKAAIRPNVEGSWYILGEEVVYQVQDSAPLAYLKGIKGRVYNSYNEVVDEKEISVEDMIQSGWKWTPTEPGFYEVQFLGIQQGGLNLLPIVSPFVRMGRKYTVDHIGVYERDRHGFVVAAHETKPIEQRNQHMYFSEHGSMPLAFKLADYIGFSGIRIHWIPWGPYGSDPVCIQPERGVYNWDFMDERINGMKEYGYNIIGNVLYTPRWASSHPESTNLGSFGMYDYSIYAPADMKDWNDFLTALVNRYGDDIKAWEIWNEPNLPGSSAFWKDTPENYALMLKNAYTTIKGLQPEAQIIIGGVGGTGYLSFYKALYQDPDISNYYDSIGMHGRLTDIWDYNRVEERAGVDNKPYMNTEAHYMLLNSKTSPKVDYTEQELSLQMMNYYFRDLKYGATDITLFHVYHSSQTELETLPFCKEEDMTQDSSCMYRYTPYAEPRHMVSVLHTFFDLMGKDFKYEKEFLLKDNVKSVLFANDGKPFLALWTESGNQFKLDDRILQCVTEETIFYDWEGRIVQPKNNMLTGATMYFITGLDQKQLDQIETSENSVIVNEQLQKLQNANVPSGVSNAGPIFNKDTFQETESIVWNETDWNWVKGTDEINEDFKAKYAISATEEGLYLIVDVTDEVYVPNTADTSDVTWQFDSLQVALDTAGYSETADRIELQIGTFKGKPNIYKETCPYVGGNLINNWTKSGSDMPGKYVNIEQKDGHIIYKVFLPTSELYPFAYVGGEEALRISVLVNDNDGDGRKGYLEWSSGIGGTKDPVLYGKVTLGGE